MLRVVRGGYSDIVAASAGETSFPRLLEMALASDDENLALRCLDHRVPAPGEVSPSFDGSTLMRAACKWGHANVVRRLVANGHSVTLPDHVGATPLHVAAGAGHGKVVEVLLESGADPIVRDASGLTPLEFARRLCGGGRLSAIEALLWPFEWPAAARRQKYLAERAAGMKRSGE